MTESVKSLPTQMIIQTDFERIIVNQVNNEEEQAGNNIEEAERIELLREELTEKDQVLKAMFITQLENTFIITSDGTKRKASQG